MSNNSNDLAIVSTFSQLFQLEPIGGQQYKGHHLDFATRSVYGGQMVSQAMVAAQSSVKVHQLRSLHSYFLEPGDKTRPVIYSVQKVRDGRTFSSRYVTAHQESKVIFEMSALFQQEGPEGLSHQADMPDVPQPDTLEDDQTLRARWLAEGEKRLAELLGLSSCPSALRKLFLAQRPVDIRPIYPVNPLLPTCALGDLPPGDSLTERAYWFRFKDPSFSGALCKEPILVKAALAYMSDYGLLGASLKPHGLSFLDKNLKSTSLDHSVWFHRDADLSDWFLYHTQSGNLSQSRGLNFGKIFDQSGQLVASTAQEGLIRFRN